ncbi:MerR family transcriptional regulator [Saccharopolyspora sp. HNM0983]|uniref:MerR family transcriptional regulator n=1 Tax=Saccharopolyspora montiporae TaxID=2781240 RepID=A0A929BCN1_9PSEU|nr:MerR family transcriptional regulator [Saccharopolyspora sp. HNM0983]MBE9375057.1 MerR family transcriptional regulator [Saccharopolyspora sp. HNM0983]
MSGVTARPEQLGGDVPGNSFDPGEPTGEPASGSDEHPQQRDDEPRLTVAAVARRLGVAPATLRTWDRRYGLGPTDHASGKHRRYGPADIARLEQMQRALLRGASPAEAARYAHSHAAREVAGSSGAEGAAAGSSGAGGAVEVSGEEREAPLMMSGVLEAEGEEIDVSAPSTGGRGLRLTGAAPAARGLGRAALSLDSWSAQQLLLESLRDDGVVATWTSMLQPVLRAVSERRQRTGADAEVLQLLAECSATALRSVIASAPPPINPRPVVLAPVPGEPQELDLVALAAALAAAGVGHRLFGAALPREALAAAVRRSAPAAVVLWSEQPPYAAPGVLDDIPVTRQRSRVFLGGGGWSAGALPPHVELLGGFETAVDRISSAVLG